MVVSFLIYKLYLVHFGPQFLSRSPKIWRCPQDGGQYLLHHFISLGMTIRVLVNLTTGFNHPLAKRYLFLKTTNVLKLLDELKIARNYLLSIFQSLRKGCVFLLHFYEQMDVPYIVLFGCANEFELKREGSYFDLPCCNLSLQLSSASYTMETLESATLCSLLGF